MKVSKKRPGHMNNAARSRYFARVIAVLTERLAPEDREVRIPLHELANCRDVRLDLDEDCENLIIALGDK